MDDIRPQYLHSAINVTCMHSSYYASMPYSSTKYLSFTVLFPKLIQYTIHVFLVLCKIVVYMCNLTMYYSLHYDTSRYNNKVL